MADLEAVLADVSYLMAMEKSKCTPAARASKKIILPDPRLVEFIICFRVIILGNLIPRGCISKIANTLKHQIELRHINHEPKSFLQS